MSRRLPRHLCLALTGLALLACQQTRPTLHDLDYPGALQPPATLPIEVQWQQRVTAAWREGPDGELHERSFDAALLRRGDQLVVLGLSPMGSVGFSITLGADGAIGVDDKMPEQMVIPPRFILLDVQRAFYPWLPAGTLEGDVGDEHVTERRDGDRLLERTFVRRSGEPAGAITVTCSWSADRSVDGEVHHAPGRVVLDNGWFGYRLTIDTIAETLLDTDDAHADADESTGDGREPR
ncbi:MAG: DUF3261 domain-containing protein [Planctomycetes bacterium]|nr:DUF3261 domain-containing protein [Planctomycetota bacterium]